MNSKTRTLIQQIKTKLKSNLTEQAHFHSDDAVIEHSISMLHQDLKRRGLL